MKKENILSKIPKGQWIKHWSGPWSLLTCSYEGTLFYQKIKEYLGTNMKYSIFISRKGRGTCYLNKIDVDTFGKELSSNKKVTKWCTDLVARSDMIHQIMNTKKPTHKDYKNFLHAFYEYGVAHVGVKKIVDYLSEKELQKFHSPLEKARKYSEPVYTDTEQFMERCVKLWGERLDESLTMTQDEFEFYLKTGKTPPKSRLRKRFERSALVVINGKEHLIEGAAVDVLEQKLIGNSSTVKGQTAYPGKVRGIARIIFDPKKAKKFSQGDILITPMTRPEYLPLFSKAGAVVTDAGGILCHAAITAREMKKPCVIGTVNATSVIKNGAMVEVDAGKGTVKVLKQPPLL